MRNLSYAGALSEATIQLMEENDRVFVMGLGADDPKGVFGTTLNVYKKFPQRVMGMPIAENGMTGVVLGAAAAGMRPILTHQRVDFMLMGMDQLANHLAKWHFLTGGKKYAPVTIRTIIGRGWGQASQHSQSFQALFAHIPGLQVVMPYTPRDAKGMLISAVRGNHPTVIIEHRWLHRDEGEVPEEMYEVPIGKAKVLKEGQDITVVGISLMNTEIKKALPGLDKAGIDIEWIDLRSIKPWDREAITESVKKTGRIIIADTGHKSFGAGAEIIAAIAEYSSGILKSPARRVSWPDYPVPCGEKIESEYYPDFNNILDCAVEIMGRESQKEKKTRAEAGEKKFDGAF